MPSRPESDDDVEGSTSFSALDVAAPVKNRSSSIVEGCQDAAAVKFKENEIVSMQQQLRIEVDVVVCTSLVKL